MRHFRSDRGTPPGEAPLAAGEADNATGTDGRATDGRATDGRATDGRATDGRATDGRATDGRATDGRATATLTAATPTAATPTAATRPALSNGPAVRPPSSDLANPGPSGDKRAAIVRLLLVLVGAGVVSVYAHVGKTVLVLVAILVMIVLHELGHYVMAKLAGIKVTEFFVGFGPRLWSVRRGETEYGVKAIPAGGYVKIIGMNSLEEVDPVDEARTYRQQPFWRRISVAVAGSAMHFLIALVLLFTIFFVIGDQGFFGPSPGNNSKVAELDALATGPSPAQKAGFHLGDRVLSVNGTVFPTIDDLIDYIHARPDQTLDFLVRRDGHLVNLYPTTVDLSKVKTQATPGAPAPTATTPTGFVGFSLDALPVHYGFFESFSQAGGSFVHLWAENFSALASLFSAHGVSSYANMIVNKKAADSPTALRFESPVGIVRIAHRASSAGLEETLYLLILINIFVGIFNMVPMLPLDGGHVAIAIYEKVRSRKGNRYYADAAKMMPFVYAALGLILFIGVSALFLDIRDLVSIVRI